MEKKSETHPSYAQLAFSRVHAGGGKTLYGSSLRHSEIIRMRIMKSELQRDLHETNYYAHGTLVEVDMSPQQFAQAITSMNMGSGVPVTLYRMNCKQIEECPHENEREQFSAEFQEKVDSVLETAKELINEAGEILGKKGTIKVAERQQLLGTLNKIAQELGSNMKFTNDMFQESMDKATAAAKHEIESFWRGTVEQLGVQALAEKANPPRLLGEDVTPMIDEK